jgi:ABC-type branched-subunit amino acid transport system ATPase component
VRDLDVSYGDRQVLFGVDLDVGSGEVLALLGTNGAGKSTLLRAISGLSHADRGHVAHRGRDVTAVDAAARVALGIVQVPGGRAVFPSMSVLDNLLAGCHLFAWNRDRVEARIGDVLGLFPRLGERLDQVAGTLSGGEQQMLALAKALVLEPDVLLVDELSLGLAPVVVQELLEVVRGLNERGTTMVIVEQSVNVALAIADRAVWMEKGRIRWTGPAAGLLDRTDLVRAVFLSPGTAPP